jgi:predicted dehydrogenase
MREGAPSAAVIGCGFFAQNHLHAWQDLAAEGLVELVALCDLDAAKAAAAASTFGVRRHYTDAAAMLTAERPDFVDVVTTMPSHRELVERAAAAGVAAIVQKPFAPDIGDCRAMVEACAEAHVALMVHENFRFQTPLRAVREVLDSGALGEPFFARISWRTGYDIYANQPYLALEERFIILDLVIHLLDVARFLFGEVRRVTCRTASIRPGIKGEDVATVLLEHQDPVTCVVDATYQAPQDPDPFPETLIEIDGSAGTLRLRPGYELALTGPGGSERRAVAPALLPWASRPWHGIQESVLNTQRHWLECLREGCEPATSGADNLRTFALCEAAYASAATGDTVTPSV